MSSTLENPDEKNRRHPVATAVLLVATVRVVVLAVAIVISGGGLASWAFTAAFHAGFTLVLGAVLLLVWKLLPLDFLRAGFTGAALVMLSFCVFLSVSDPILMAIIGERLTPSTLGHFSGPGLFLSDYFWKPVRAYWPAVSAAVGLLVLYGYWVGRQFWTLGRQPRRTPVTWRRIAIALVIGLGLTQGSLALSPDLLRPVETSYVEEALGIDGTHLGMSEAKAIALIRDFTGLPAGAEWADDRYPLVYRWKDAKPTTGTQPDIFIFVVESMRGASLRPTNPTGENLASVPAIEQLASEGVVFQHFLSNGFPSGPGFVGLSSGAWMHTLKRLDAAYSSTAFDRLGFRLRSAGYRTGVVTYDVRYDDKTTWVHNVFEDVVDCVALGLPAADSVSADQFIEWVGKADAAPAKRPLFGIFLSKEPHLPYLWQDDAGQWTFGKNLAENYARSIRQVDATHARMFAALRSRPRWKDTVVIILGDHANFLSQDATTGLPVNDTVFTGAIIAGGSPHVGSPRVDREPASQSDIATTVLALAGDRRPAMTLGRDLLNGTPGRVPRALAIRNGGSRLDMGNHTLLLTEHRADRARLSESGFPTATPATPPHPETVAAVVRTWAWLIEHNRVWNPDFLNEP